MEDDFFSGNDNSLKITGLAFLLQRVSEVASSQIYPRGYTMGAKVNSFLVKNNFFKDLF